jgi:hypothetical protein
MKQILTLCLDFVAGLFLAAHEPKAAPVDETLARAVAGNFLGYLGSRGAGHQIEAITPFERDGTRVGFLISLAPRGYVLIAGESIRVPVKAYSLQTAFNDLPPPYVNTLRNELSIPLVAATAASSGAPESTNSTFWSFLTSDAPIVSTQAYVPDTFLLTTQWNQYAPYNNFLPLIGGERTLTGCTQTAVEQQLGAG